MSAQQFEFLSERLERLDRHVVRLHSIDADLHVGQPMGVEGFYQLLGKAIAIGDHQPPPHAKGFQLADEARQIRVKGRLAPREADRPGPQLA